MLRIGTVVMGVTDVEPATAFWCDALQYAPREDPEDDWVVLVPKHGSGAALALGLSESPLQEHPRLHLDLYADDQAAEVTRLLSIGARAVDWDLYGDDPDFVVVADPEGNLFCVVDTTHGWLFCPGLRRRSRARTTSASPSPIMMTASGQMPSTSDPVPGTSPRVEVPVLPAEKPARWPVTLLLNHAE